MSYYYLIKDSAGKVKSCLEASDPPTDLGEGAVEVTQEQFDAACDAIMNPVLTLAQQATSALASARTYVSYNYTMLNEATPDAWVTYLKALMAISSGSDTTSAALPAAPAT